MSAVATEAAADRPAILSEDEVRATRRMLALLDSEALALHEADDGSGIVSRVLGELAEVLREHVVPCAPAKQWSA
jgi:hypothetical protein